jgi:hypothetical protein
MKNSVIILLTLTSLTFISVNQTSAQPLKCNFLVKPINEYTLSENTIKSKSDYCHHEKTYSVQQPLSQVWNFYNTVNTKDVWDSKNAKYIMSYDNNQKKSNSVQSDLHDTLKQYKTYLLQLSFLIFIKIKVIFQITKIDSINKIIEFTYMKENKSNGFQTLQFSEVNGQTLIKHTSYFTSGNNFRDKYIYPKFHEVALDDFHSHVFNLLNMKIEIQNVLAVSTTTETSK